MNKYGAKKTTVDGITFDSVKEARRYQELLLLQRAKEINFLRRQVSFTLIPSQRDQNGKVVERECKYIADFVYMEKGKTELTVEDTKGVKTKDYIIKRKLMLKEYGIRIKEI